MELLRSNWLVLAFLVAATGALRYDPGQVGFNLNENVTATDPLDYWGEWHNHTYFPSPTNWRVPFYTLFLDRYVNGDPTNDDVNGTQFEHDVMSNQLRHGGDVKGLMDSFDYIQGMGIKAIYIAGMPHINEPWGSDAFSPLDLTLLDRHFGNIDEWRAMISEAHRRGIYIVLENTMSTMGDLIGFEGYLNTSAPFESREHNFVWKDSRQYLDFQPGNNYIDQCEYPRFWGDDGRPVTNLSTTLVGCRDSEFDQYGEIASFGNYPEWQRQISKFAFVQDRLREWRSDVRAKIERFSCITIAMLDIDGFRIDKALQVTVDAQGEWSDAMRKCARDHGKNNFYIPGEIVAGNSFGAVFIGRGKEPEMYVNNITEAVSLTNDSNPSLYIRAPEKAALDGAAFHYSVYRALTRFLGMDGTFEAEGDPPVNFIDTWNGLLQTNDMVNANTGEFDPRQMYGISNQDVFRWPSIVNGTEKQILGTFIVTLLMPGIPLLTWGEEQAFYVLDNQNANYVFGRSPMSSAQAWQIHGCYKVGSVKYANFPVESASYGCQDDNVSLDQRDASHPVRNIIKGMVEMRQNYPVLNDGYYLQQLSNKTHDVYLPGSNGTRTETGLWSVLRAHFNGAQNLTTGQGNQKVWLVYHNENQSVEYDFNCLADDALISPFDEGTTVKNLFPPYEEYTLDKSSKQLGFDGSTKQNGCVSKLKMPAWGFKTLVPKESFVTPAPVITKFTPGHDFRMLSTIASGGTAHFVVEFSQEMDCNSISNGLQIRSSTDDKQTAKLSPGSVQCNFTPVDPAKWIGAPDGVWTYAADLVDVSHGIHDIAIVNATTRDGKRSTNSVDHFFLRIGAAENPLVWPKQANYSDTLLYQSPNGTLWVNHKAAGADKWRYSLNFGTTYSDWLDYEGGNSTLAPKVWSGRTDQQWPGEHVIVQYWNSITGSSDHLQHGDVNAPRRRFPHLFLQGNFNQQLFDSGLPNTMQLSQADNLWHFNFMTEWPAFVSINAWGMNPDGQPDQTQVYGDIDGDNILDRLPLKTLLSNVINVTDVPPSPYLAWHITLDDATLRYTFLPVGSRWSQLVLYILLALIPISTATAAAWVYLKSFAQVKFNQIGVSDKKTLIPMVFRRQFQRLQDSMSMDNLPMAKKSQVNVSVSQLRNGSMISLPGTPFPNSGDNMLFADAGAPNRRTVLIATMEYDIEDWAIKIKIGGLGVMAQLMGKNLSHQDLVWVVPCVGGVDYPVTQDEIMEPMEITVLGNTYAIQVYYHVLRNITYVLLDAPIFRQQTKSEPYPPRMDDLESAIYYSAWNSCIAEAIKRFPVDLYHINDYHGAIAPLHLLPRTIPCALSLHNAEFQGLWPMRTVVEREEVCKVFNLEPKIVEEYVQFGEVFNLLHAGASYLRIHQKGFGAVGVSKKYGKRSYARYPIFWGLKQIGALPNPDPSDTKEWSKDDKVGDISVDPEFEDGRVALKQKAQEWAGLDVNHEAELFVFVGRWSMQKGIDLIADVFPSVLESNPNVQLICIGPVIDLYGSFAALKLDKMMKVYPGRVFSKPEFTALPPYIFSGAEFALIPSRDEPFGLVAVEFGRKGALGVGSRVGGLGQMPGWWFTVESMTTKHLTSQFKMAINDALASKKDVRAMMRARSAKQRFPVAQWVEDLDILQTTAIERHQKYGEAGARKALTKAHRHSAASTTVNTPALSKAPSREPSPTGEKLPVPELYRLGSRRGPGHMPRGRNPNARRGPAHDNMNSHISEAELDSDEEGYHSIIDSYEDDDSRRPSQTRYNSNFRDLTNPNARFRSPSYPNTSPAPGTPRLGIVQAPTFRDYLNPPPNIESPTFPGTDSDPGTPSTPVERSLLNPNFNVSLKQVSALSLDQVVGGKSDYRLQKVSPFFTDPNKEYYGAFGKMLDSLNGKSSESDLCIEEYLAKSEKSWFSRYHDARMGKISSARPATAASNYRPKRFSRASSVAPSMAESSLGGNDSSDDIDQFLIDKDYVPPSGLKRFLDRRIGDWPVYSLFLGFGQIIAANSYQISLLTGEVGQPSEKLYVVATIYLFSSIAWWLVFRSLKSIYVLSLPFLLYGSAFMLIGCAPFVSSTIGRGWVQNAATGAYAIASASGSVFFALNFAEEGGAPITSWVYRACVIQGSQQIYVVALWYWGTSLAQLAATGQTSASLASSNPHVLTAIGMSIAVVMWLIGFMLWAGLPEYYRQAPGYVPSFYKSLLSRKIIAWFFFMVAVQNYWLSAPYGRNWLYLWSSQHVPAWQIAILAAFFFIGVWAGLLWIFGILSKSHAWVLPIFAIGLGAPRWCQMLWSTSNIGQYVPWAGGPIASAFAGRSLWLWLGVLDSLQGVGKSNRFGMILLNTLTRFHIAFTLLAAQVLGSIATILARATAPDAIGPGDVFPDFSAGFSDGLSKVWFWIALAFQISICVMCFFFFRKEQLAKP